jgi:recombination protein RecA
MKPDPKLVALHDSLQKQFGEKKIMYGSKIPVGTPIPTGSLALDFSTGFGGFPSNRAVEISGRNGTGKTTLALFTMLNALAKNPHRAALFLDVEHKVTKEWLRLIVGDELMDTNRVIYVQPTSIENATNIYREAVESGLICCAVLDSIGGAPTVRFSDDAEKGRVGGNSIGVGEFARAAATFSAVYDCLTIGVNQLRVVMNSRIPNLMDTPGGEAWKCACILRVELVRGRDTEHAVIDGEKMPIGYTIMAKIRKNQVGAPGRTAMYWFYNVFTPEHGFGIDKLDEINRLSIMTRVVRLAGGWYNHLLLPGGKVHGLPAYQQAVREDIELQAALSAEVLAVLKDYASEVAPISDPDAPVEENTSLMGIYLTGGADGD